MFQFFNLVPTLTVEENLLLPLELNGRGGEPGRRAARAPRRGGPRGPAATFPDRLSGGEQQRVAVARALVHDPELVLADEPTGNLDLDTGRQVLELLDRLTRQAGKTLVMVTHASEVAGLADRRSRLQDGRLVAGEPPAAVTRTLLRAGPRQLAGTRGRRARRPRHRPRRRRRGLRRPRRTERRRRASGSRRTRSPAGRRIRSRRAGRARRGRSTGASVLEAGVRPAAPVVEGYAARARSPRADVAAPRPGSAGRGAVPARSARAASAAPLGFVRLVAEPGAVVVAATAARELGLARARAPRPVDGRTHELVVAARGRPGRRARRRALDAVLLTDVATAQEGSGSPAG